MATGLYPGDPSQANPGPLRPDHQPDRQCRAAGNLARILGPEPCRTSLRYAGSNRPVAWINPLGDRTSSAFDGSGRVSRVVLPLGQRLTLSDPSTTQDGADGLSRLPHHPDLRLVRPLALGDRRLRDAAVGRVRPLWAAHRLVVVDGCLS